MVIKLKQGVYKMIRLFLGGAGLGLCIKLFIKSDDFVSQTLALLFVPIFIVYIREAISKISSESE
jgi:ABC-type phosphate transport system permease subunit